MNKLSRRIEAWKARKNKNKFSSFALPIIKKMDYKSFAEAIVSVQPMSCPANNQPESYVELYDLSNPREGQIFRDGEKSSNYGCSCCRAMWSKIWTPLGWVKEKRDAAAYKLAVEVYNPRYKAEIAEEREAWNKAHGITDEGLYFPMAYVFDSKNLKR